LVLILESLIYNINFEIIYGMCVVFSKYYIIYIVNKL